MFKKYLALMILGTMLLSSVALADGPTSQFGFTGWPYRQSTGCGTNTTSASASPTRAPSGAPATGSATASRPSSTVGDYTTQSVSAQEQMMLNLLNEDRNRYGLPSLTLDSTLSGIARTKSCDMRDNRYFSHESPTYGRVKDMLKTFGYKFNGAGENIAHHATVEKAQAAFMSSSAHRQNILSSAWTKVGIGICYDQNGFVYVTQIFVR